MTGSGATITLRTDLLLIKSIEEHPTECVTLPPEYQDAHGRIFVYRNRRQYRYHRWLYKRIRSKSIRNRQYLRRICPTSECLNPNHYSMIRKRQKPEPGPRKPGSGQNVAAMNRAKATCSKGHELSGDNLRIEKLRNGSTRRHCRTCDRLRRAA